MTQRETSAKLEPMPDEAPHLDAVRDSSPEQDAKSGVDNGPALTVEEDLDRTLETSSENAPNALAVAGPRQAQACLVVVRGELAGKMLPLVEEPPWTLGRAAGTALTLANPSVSPQHARIEPDGDRFLLVDLGSALGTLLNGRAVRHPVSLRGGDTIEIGDTALVFVTQDPGEVRATEPIQIPVLRRDSEGPALPMQWQGAHGGVQRSASGVYPAPWAAAAEQWSEDDRDDDDRGPSVVQLLARLLELQVLLRRHWPKLLGLPLVCGALGLATLLVKPPPSEIEFQIGIQWQEPENPLEERAPRPGWEDRTRFYNAAVASFTDARLVRSTLQRLGTPNPDDDMVRGTAKRLELTTVREGVFRGSMRTQSAEKAIRFVNAHIDAFIRTEVEKTLRVVQAQIDFMSQQVDEKNKALLQTEQALQEFKTRHLMQLPENAGNRLGAAPDLESRRGTLTAAVVRLEGELKLAQEQLDREAPLLEARVAAAAPYRESRDDAIRRLAQARARGLGAEHPDILKLEREVATFEQKAEEATKSDVSSLERLANPAYTELKDRVGALRVQLTAAQSELNSIGGQLGDITKTVAVMPELEAEHARLTRTYEMDRGLHGRLVERLRQAQLQSELDRASARARYETIVPPHSLGVRLGKTLLLRSGIGVALGLLLAFAWATIVELRRVIRDTPELQALANRTNSK